MSHNEPPELPSDNTSPSDRYRCVDDGDKTHIYDIMDGDAWVSAERTIDLEKAR